MSDSFTYRLVPSENAFRDQKIYQLIMGILVIYVEYWYGGDMVVRLHDGLCSAQPDWGR